MFIIRGHRLRRWACNNDGAFELNTSTKKQQRYKQKIGTWESAQAQTRIRFRRAS